MNGPVAGPSPPERNQPARPSQRTGLPDTQVAARCDTWAPDPYAGKPTVSRKRTSLPGWARASLVASPARFDPEGRLQAVRTGRPAGSPKSSERGSTPRGGTHGRWLSLARALGSEPRERWFESTSPDHRWRVGEWQ